LLDVNRGNEPHLAAIMEKLEQICRSGQFIGGPHCQELESSVAALCQTKFAIGCASGSDALLLALMAIDLQPGDEVIVPSFTFFASVSAITRLGGIPVFIDIEPETFNMNARLLRGLITPRTRAIMPVHLFGQCCDMDAIRSVASEHGLHIIEDAAQAIGASFNGEMAGSMGSFGCISFYPTKNLGGFGDAGMITCNDPALAAKVRLLANHGMQPRYYHQVVGINSRLDSMQAAVLCSKLPSLRLYAAARERNARTYEQELAAAAMGDSILTPCSDPRCEHVWNQFTIRIGGGRRDEVRAAMAARGIGSEIYYPVPMHQQQCFSYLNCPAGSLPETERAAGEVLSLPIFPELTRQELKRVVKSLVEVVGSTQGLRRAA
jgi:dTDP-4-amino-4,6-dideoxygalactose transaminase